MQQSTTRGIGRPSHIVRAASLEVEIPKPATPTSATSEPVIACHADESADAKALHGVLVALGKQVEDLRGRRRQTLRDLAGVSVELGVAIAERLLGTEIAANRQRLDLIVRLALERLPLVPAVVVHGHPDDMALLEKQMAGHDDLASFREVLTLPATAPSRGAN